MSRLKRSCRGGASLVIVLILLLSAGLASMYLNRHVLTEQRAAANLSRSTVALETAEAGLEWATALLNHDGDVDTSCMPSAVSTDTRFRVRYLLTRLVETPPSSAIKPSGLPLGCRLDGSRLSCSCPTAAAAFKIGDDEAPSFTVSFLREADDAVRIVSRGCVADTRACTAADMRSTDGHAVVEAVLKLNPYKMPASALTCGGSCLLGGSRNIVNRDLLTNGVLVNAGTTISIEPGTTLKSLPGTIPSAGLVPGDESLRELSSVDPTCERSAMFKTYFGTSLADYRTSATRLSCTSASDCESRLMTAYGAGKRAFYFDSDVQLAGNRTLGSPAEPVMLVTPHALSISGGWTIYGLVFSNSANIADNGTGAANIIGAQITCANYASNGNGTTEYNAAVLANLTALVSPIVRVPGSWKDF